MIDAEVTTLAILWRIARADGVTLGFTTHDAPLVVGGLTYDSAPGMVPSAISTGDGLEVDTMEVAGALSAVAITAADLGAGRYDGARVTVAMVDWRDPGGAVLPLARGTLGEVSQSASGSGGAGAAGGTRGGSFTAELRGPTAAFDAAVIEVCSPECRAELGDARCRVDLAPLTVMAMATEVEPGRVAVSAADPRFAGGRLRMLAGPNAGLDRRIVDTGAGTLDLDEPLPFALAAGTPVELREGCDKRFATCAGRFANTLNFRGEPHVPGGDLLTRFPGL